MKNYRQLILHELLNKYEKSKLSKEGSSRNIRISIPSSHSIFSDYWSDVSYLYKDQIDMILSELVEHKFIVIRLNKNKEFEYVDLIIDSISDTYHFLGRVNPEVERIKILQYLDSIKSNNEIVTRFIHFIRHKMNSFQSVLSYFENIDELTMYIDAIEAMALLEEDTLKRNFSKSVFNDSKLFEKNERKIIRIIREFSEEEVDDDDELLALFHIVKTPTFAYIKGGITIKVNDQVIDLLKYGHEVSLSSSVFEDLDVLEVQAKKVITIENLTTFVSFNNPDYVAVYLGGFHNRVKRLLLGKIYTYNSNIKFYHFGDIDAGGLLIFDDLVSKTGIEFEPYFMDIETLEKHKKNWIKLTKNDKKRIKKITNKKFYKLIKYMIENDCKLEQEAIT